jgi:AcrR family transcriptional regulator
MTAATPIKRSRGRPRSQASEDAILDATLELLAQEGFRGLTVDKVAARASASKATIYRRWSTKENLAIAAFQRTAPLQASGKGPPLRQLVDIIYQFSQFMRDTPLGGVLPALAAERNHNPDLDEALTPLMHSRRQPIIDVIEQAIEAGELPAGIDVEDFADQCLGPVVMRIMLLNQPAEKPYVANLVECARRAVESP